MDPQPSGGSPSSSLGSSQRNKARKRLRDDSDEDPPSLGSLETSSHPPTQPDSPGPGASADGATASKFASLLEECHKPLDEGGSPSSSLGSSQRNKARKRPRDDSDEDPPSLGSSETSSHPPTQPDSPGPGASADGATASKFVSLLEECHKPLDEEGSTEYEGSDDDLVASDSESSTEDIGTPRKLPCKEKQAGPIFLSTMKNINGLFTGETLDFRLPCTATEGTACQIVDHLSAWNEFFCLVSWALREIPGTSGKLSLLFFRDPSPSYCSPQQLHLVTLLACQLLKTHCCVAHIELDIRFFNSHYQILSDALRASPSITSVKLAFSSRNGDEDLATAVLSLPHLKELNYTGIAQYSATLVARHCTFLQTTTSLAALRVSDECPGGMSAEDFFRVLGQNCSLQELVLPSDIISEAPPSAQAVCTEWLTNSVSLKSLTLTSVFRVRVLKCILEGLLGNRSIVAVDLRCPKIDQADVHLMSKIFEQNKVLQSFNISYEYYYYSTMSSVVQGRPDKADWDRCLKALVENDSLEDVTLPINVWDEDQWIELFEALPTKRNLKRVSIDAHGRAPPSFLSKLCAALKETGADEKVSFNGDFISGEFDEGLMCKAIPNVIVHASDRNVAAVHGILERMPSLGHITCLHLDFDMEFRLDPVLSSSLATFLGATRTLKTLILTASLDTMLYDFQEALVDGLADNTSLREVQIDVHVTTIGFFVFSEPLADVINASKNISWVYLGVGGPFYGERAFLRRLSTGMADNYTLLNVTVVWYRNSKFKRSLFNVWDATRRNCGLLTNAADFARGARHDRRCALALERMHGHPELVEQVARLEKVDQARAAAMVRHGLRSIEGMHAFMRLAGVVKESVSCHACKDGRMQLDSLNEDCWRAIRRYVKLFDIRHSTTGVPPQ